jgi:hypothetical protein
MSSIALEAMAKGMTLSQMESEGNLHVSIVAGSARLLQTL